MQLSSVSSKPLNCAQSRGFGVKPDSLCLDRPHVCSQSRVSTAVFVPEDAQHRQEQHKELGQHPHSPSHPAKHAAGFISSLNYQDQCSVPVLHSSLLSPAPLMPFLGVCLSREPPNSSGDRRGWSWVGEGGTWGCQSSPATLCPQHGSGAGAALAEDTSCSG